MNFIYYSRMADGVGRRIQGIVEHQFSGAEIEVFRDVESLTQRLCGPVGEDTAALLLAGTGRELEDLLAIGPFMNGIRSVLILSDRTPDRTQEERARKILKPRFITHLGNEYLHVEIASVLKSMQEIMCLCHKPPEPARRFKLLHRFGLA